MVELGLAVALVVRAYGSDGPVFTPVLIQALTASSDHSESHCFHFLLFRHDAQSYTLQAVLACLLDVALSSRPSDLGSDWIK